MWVAKGSLLIDAGRRTEISAGSRRAL